MDRIETIVRDIMTRFDVLNAATGPAEPMRFDIGALRADFPAGSIPPRMWWVETGGDAVEARILGGAGATLGDFWANFTIFIHHEKVEWARDAMMNLMSAARASCDGPNVRFTRYDFPSQTDGRWIMKGGQLLVLLMSFRWSVPVAGVPGVTQVQLLSYQSDAGINAGDVSIANSATP